MSPEWTFSFPQVRKQVLGVSLAIMTSFTSILSFSSNILSSSRPFLFKQIKLTDKTDVEFMIYLLHEFYDVSNGENRNVFHRNLSNTLESMYDY